MRMTRLAFVEVGVCFVLDTFFIHFFREGRLCADDDCLWRTRMTRRGLTAEHRRKKKVREKFHWLTIEQLTHFSPNQAEEEREEKKSTELRGQRKKYHKSITEYSKLAVDCLRFLCILRRVPAWRRRRHFSHIFFIYEFRNHHHIGEAYVFSCPQKLETHTRNTRF